MGYISTIRNFKHDRFTVAVGVTEEKIKKLLANARDLEEFEHWFDLEVDPDSGELEMTSTDESGKAYSLGSIMVTVVKVLSKLEAKSDLSAGFKFSFEVWGEDGDAVLYSSDGKNVSFIVGKMEFKDEPTIQKA